MSEASTADAPSYEADIKPLFSDRDHRSMTFKFDLWSYSDVSAHADVILQRLEAGTMPCYGPWPKDQVDRFARWVEGGKRP